MPASVRYTIICCYKVSSAINNKQFHIQAVGMASRNEQEDSGLLTMSNIKYLVEGLEALLMTDLDGEKRRRVIQLRNDLLAQINSIFSDYS